MWRLTGRSWKAACFSAATHLEIRAWRWNVSRPHSTQIPPTRPRGPASPTATTRSAHWVRIHRPTSKPARRAAARALALDPDLPEALCVLAKVAWQYEWDWAKAERLFEQALQSYPNRADLHIAYSDFCCYMRYGDRAIEHAEKAMAVDPVSPWVSSLMAQACYMHDRNEEAIEHARRTLELAPGFPFAHFFHGMALMRHGEPDAAIEEIEQAAASGRSDFFAVLGNWYALMGRRAEAEQILEAMQAADTPAPPIAFVGLHLGLGNLDEAREAFRRSIDAHDWHILILHADPLMIEAARGTDLPELLEPLNLPEDQA